MSLELKGRGAIIVGAKRIGASVAKRLAAEGVNLAIVYRRSKDEAQQLLDTVKPHAERCLILQADIGIESDVLRVVEEAKAQLGDLSICINLAADYPSHTLDELDGDAWERGMAIAKGNYLLAVSAAHAMTAQEGAVRGHMIFFGDWAAEDTPYRDYLPYLTAKAAVHFMTHAFALELAPRGILVNAILPGPTARPPEVTDAEWSEALALAPLHRASSVDDIAEMTVTLLRSETITGETIRIDSGRHFVGPGLPEETSP